MFSRFWLLLTTSLVACAGAPPPAPVAHASPPSVELREARELLAQLPAGADGCLVAWPGRLSERRRRLVARLSMARGFPFIAPESPRVYVEAWRARPDGGVSRVMIWSFAGSAERLRTYVVTRAPLASRFDVGDGADTTYAARFVAPDRLQLSHGAWPDDAGRGVEAGCAAELSDAVRHHAFELSAGGRAPVDAFAHGPSTVRDLVISAHGRSRLLLPAHGGVREREREQYAEEAIRDLALGVEEEDTGSPRTPLDDALLPIRSRASGETELIRTRRVSYADLELLAEDDADRRQAIMLAQRAQSPAPVAEVDVSDLSAVEHQVRLRRVQLELSSPAERDSRRRELLELLRRGQAAQPTEARVALPFVRLVLELDQDADAALDALAAIASTGSVSSRELGPLRREALSHRSAAALAEALEADMALPASAATRAAHALIGVRRTGRAYETAEGLWLAQHELASGHSRAMGRAPRAISWPVGSLAETAAALIDQGGVERSLYVVARAADLDSDAGNLPADLGPHATLHFSENGDGVWVLGATTRGDFALARIGALLDSRVRGGALDLLVAVVPFGADAAEPASWLHVTGRVEGGRLEVVRLGLGGAPAVSWTKVARFLADPLASAGPQVFPSPRLDVRTEDGEQSQSVAAALEAVADCESRPGGLVCRPRADRGALSRALAALCREESR